MVPGVDERPLLFDRELHRKLSAVAHSAPAEAWEAASSALNLRSMTSLAAEMSQRGLSTHGDSEKLWYEHILSVALAPEKLDAAFRGLEASPLDPSSKPVLLALIDYYLERDSQGIARLKALPPEARGARFHEILGHYAMARHAFREALQRYRDANRAQPGNSRVLCHIAEAYRSLDEKAKAMAWLYRAVRKERHSVQAWNSLCRLHLESDQAELARQAMGMALSINPRDWGIYFALADHHMDRGRFDRASATLRDILDIEPGPLIAAEAHNYLGYLHFQEGHYRDAVRGFQKALSLNPHLSVAWLNLGNLHFHLKELDNAASCYQEALKTDPRQSAAATQLGLTFLEQGKVEAARKPLERALKADPADYWAHLGLSECLRRTRNPAGAVDEARQALRLEPDDPDVHNYLGIALECSRRYFEAEKAYRRALALDPRHRWAANNLGYLCEKLMRLDPAYKQAAVDAWKIRLLICRDTKSSMRGALNHLRKLGVPPTVLRKWLSSAPRIGRAN